MFDVLQSKLYFANTLISLIVFLELAVNFKKPLTLKILLLGFIGSICVHNLAWQINVDFRIREFFRVFILLIGIHIIYLLHDFKLNKSLVVLTFTSILLLIFNFYTFQFINTERHDMIFWVRRVIRVLNSLGILTMFIIAYSKMFMSLDEKNQYSQKIKNWTRLTIVLASISILNNLSSIISPSGLYISRMISSIIQLTCCILVMYRPSFINRTNLSISLGNAFRKTHEDEVNAEEFIKEFFTKAYYSNNEISIEDLAMKLKVSPKIMNDFIYETTKMNFTDLVNKNRVEFYVNLVSNNQYQEYSLEGLSELAGFGSRQSLYRNFKKFHGGSPSDLLKANN